MGFSVYMVYLLPHYVGSEGLGMYSVRSMVITGPGELSGTGMVLKYCGSIGSVVKWEILCRSEKVCLQWNCEVIGRYSVW